MAQLKKVKQVATVYALMFIEIENRITRTLYISMYKYMYKIAMDVSNLL